MFAIRHEIPSDIQAREALLDAGFGPTRRAKTSERLREGRLPAYGLALVATRADALIGTLRMWNVAAGPGCPALLLGPVAIDPTMQGLGIGSKLIRDALARAAEAGHRAVILVGDAPYYVRFGFGRASVAGLWMPGPCERERFLGLELAPGALAYARGLVQPTGEAAGWPDLGALVAAAANEDRRRFAAAA